MTSDRQRFQQGSSASQAELAMTIEPIPLEDDPIDGGASPLTYYPRGYIHPANITFNPDVLDKEPEDDTLDSTDAVTCRQNQLNRRVLRKSKRDMEARRAQPAVSQGDWHRDFSPSQPDLGQPQWDTIALPTPGPSCKTDCVNGSNRPPPATNQVALPELESITLSDRNALGHCLKSSWPLAVPRPTLLPVSVGDDWYYFIPQSEEDARKLIKLAHEQNGGMAAQVRDLIRQSDLNMMLQTIKSLTVLKSSWRKTEPAPSTSKSGASKLKQPTHSDPPVVWTEYWKAYPTQVPDQLKPLLQEDGTLEDNIIRGNSIVKAMVPSFKKASGETTKLRSMLLDLGDYAILTEKDYACWAAQCGITDELVVLAERVGRIYHNFSLKREPEDDSLYPERPATIEDVLGIAEGPVTNTAMPSMAEPRSTQDEKGKGRVGDDQDNSDNTVSMGSPLPQPDNSD
ncbi:hypothetical protein LXA43DRAFT_1066258 [Ganoderma leucocontextum]|nr:hypothetical protein LXA43DRAFT_1066258 [Ganoderma leucocontextum]